MRIEWELRTMDSLWVSHCRKKQRVKRAKHVGGRGRGIQGIEVCVCVFVPLCVSLSGVGLPPRASDS